MSLRLYLDIEVYENYFLALLMGDDLRTMRYEVFEGQSLAMEPVDFLKVIRHEDVELITFNGNNFDIPVLTHMLVNQSTRGAKRAANLIIEKNVKPWRFYKDEGLREPDLNHVDLIEVAPGMVSLKIYGGRLHCQKLQDLPIPPDARIEQDQLPLLRKYCKNDLLVTQSLYRALEGQMDLRRSMSAEYGVDLRSKSDAQIAEAVLRAEYVRRTGDEPPRTRLGYESFYYQPPAYVRFATEPLQEALATVSAAEMVIDGKTGHVKMPPSIERMKIKVGGSVYKIGIGGLHSQESEVCYAADEDRLLIDRDVESYYPRMMLNMNMRPGGFGKHFNPIYEKILEERLEAKHAGDKVKSDSLKIVLNGTFGKTSSRYSSLYSPEFMVQTTLTGQLTILMLIEALERYGVSVISANTDGIVMLCPTDMLEGANTIISRWEKHTRLKTEETRYRALYSRDVNNYIAVKPDGSVKAKGVFGKPGLTKNPQTTICTEAAIAFLTRGTSLQQTVCSCRDITKFISLRTVTGGAEKDGQLLGKAIRWYYSVQEVGRVIRRVANGDTVPRSEGAKPLMDLPEYLPLDLDFQWYISEAEEILHAVGAIARPPVEKIPRKNSAAWKELLAAGRIVENRKGKWEWAK